eukprot:s55_g16.t1
MIWRREFVNTFTALGDALHLRGEVLFDPAIALWTVEPCHWRVPNISGFSCLKSHTRLHVQTRQSKLNVSFSPLVEIVSAGNTLHVEPLSPVLIADEFPTDMLSPDWESESEDYFSLLQTDFEATSNHKQVCVRHNDDVPPPQCSFTDEFLEAMRVRNQPAVEMTLPDVPINEIDRFPSFVRRLHDIFQVYIHDHPAIEESGPKIETWYLDHVRMKDCFQSRTIRLASRFDQWEQQILHEWRDHVDQFLPVEFHVVHPHPEDAEDDSVAQLILHQRPIDGFCSVLLSIYDSAYDDGRPHSYATVLANRISLEVAAVAAEFDEFCQPLHSPVDCTFWFGNLQIRPHQLVAARHGYAFRLKVRRPLEVAITDWRALSLDDLRHVLSQTLSDAEAFQPPPEATAPMPHALPMEVIHPVNDTWQPEWIDAIEAAQVRAHHTPRINPLRVNTWFLDGNHAPRSIFARSILLPLEVTQWEAVLLNAWTDHIDVHTPCFLHFVDPSPPAAAHDTAIGHILIVQNPIEHHAAILLSAIWPHDSERDPVHSALYTIDRLSASAAITLLPFALTHSFSLSTRVRRGSLVFPVTGSPRIGNGDCITGEFAPPPTEPFEAEDTMSLVQSGMCFQTPFFLLEGQKTLAIRDCKNNDHGEVILDDEPIIQSPDIAFRRSQPPIDGDFRWFEELHDVFHRYAEVEVQGASPLMYAQTWFINHDRHQYCRYPRGIRLDNVMITWIDVIRQAWLDRLDPNLPFSVFLVRPSPPRNRLQDHACHLIVEQAKPIHRAAAHVTTRFEGDRGVAFSMVALSLPSFLTLHDLIEAVRIQPHCAIRRCSARYGEINIGVAAIHEIVSGAGIKVRVESPVEQSPHQIGEPVSPAFHDDPDGLFEQSEFSFMQISSKPVRQHGLQMPDSADSSEACRFTMNAAAREFRPGQFPFADHPEYLDDVYQLWFQHAFSWEGEPIDRRILTWFVDHRIAPAHCFHSRVVVLTDDFATWDAALKAPWTAFIDPAVELSVHVVAPQPPHLESNVFAHVVLVQAPADALVTSLVTLFDAARYGDFPARAAVTTNEHIAIEHLLLACRYDLSCLFPNQLLRCEAWYAQEWIRPGVPIPGRSGYSIELHIHQNPTAIEQQLHHDRTVILLEHELPSQPHPVPIHLIDGATPPDLPSHVLLVEPFTAADVESELAALGTPRHVYLFGTTGFAFCVPVTWPHDASRPAETYVFFPLEGMRRDDVSVHGSSVVLSDIDQLRLLYDLGFSRAVLVSQTKVRPTLHLVQFHNNQPALEQLSHKPRQATPWPAPMPCTVVQKIFDPMSFSSQCPEQVLTFGLDFGVLVSFFESSQQVLCPWHSHLELPDLIRQVLPQSDPFEGVEHDLRSFDRFVIYTDGSSKSQNRRKPPLWVQEHDAPDASSYVVLGERYRPAPEPSEVIFLGWQAQQVTYEEDLSHYLGSDQIGSEFAEREALFWAAIWRLSLNLNTPTVFRSDSVTTADQSTGKSGCHDGHPTFCSLRSVMQALEASLPNSGFLVEHVRGHAGDAWNELADHLAKVESITGHKLHRQKIDLKTIQPLLPYFWMLFAQSAGLPTVTTAGFDVSAPLLPLAQPAQARESGKTRPPTSITLCLSMATLNVGSLFLGPDGFGGKLSYLRTQMRSLGLGFLGLQETRSSAGQFQAEGVLRLASGSVHGQHGVELWVNLDLPISSTQPRLPGFQAKHFQVLHADPRRLFVRLAHSCFNGLFLVLHGPQSGRPLQERRLWWSDTTELIRQYRADLPLFVLMDANAKTGPSCEPMIFHCADVSSANTEFLRSFLHEHALCLPCTSDVHQGDTATWTGVDGLSQHRIDFIAVPQHALPQCTLSSVVEELEPGNRFDDHRAVALQLHWHASSSDSCDASQTSISYNRAIIGQKAADIDFSSLHESCPIGRNSPKKPFITDEVWQLRAAKLRLRRRLQLARKQTARDALRLVFWIWRKSQTTVDLADDLLQHWAHGATVSCAMVHLNCEYFSAARKLRIALQHCKRQQLTTTLSDTSDKTSAGELLHLLRPYIGPSNPKKQKRKGLPAVLKSDGSLCTTPDEATLRWTEFFCNMEGGSLISESDYRQKWMQNLTHFRDTGALTLPLTEVPSLVDLEAAFRRVAVGKAIGADGVPPEICRYRATALARMTYPMLLKSFLYGQEAIAHKGGRLAVAWKHRGDVRECSTHRSLLISSHIGKTLHRAFRQRHHGLYTQYMQTQQLGVDRTCQ